MDMIAILVAALLSAGLGATLGHIGTYRAAFDEGIREAQDRIAHYCSSKYDPGFAIIRDDKVWTFDCSGPTTAEIKPWDKP